MANDKLVGNMPTEKLLAYFKEVDINKKELFKSLQLIDSIFS